MKELKIRLFTPPATVSDGSILTDGSTTGSSGGTGVTETFISNHVIHKTEIPGEDEYNPVYQRRKMK